MDNLISKNKIGIRTSDQVLSAVDQITARNQKSPLDLALLRKLKDSEIDQLINQGNLANSWNDIEINSDTDLSLISNNMFYGVVRIGKLEPLVLSHHDLTLPVGVYNSTVIACDIADNCSIHRVSYLAYMHIHQQCILNNIDECQTTSLAKFGNGVLQKNESEDLRIWLEIINENGGRGVLPFDGMLATDAYLWAHSKQDFELMEHLKAITQLQYKNEIGSFGEIGRRSVVKNCRILKDVKIGSYAYLKGANKLKNMTIHSDADSPSQIGEGVEMVNGIMGYGSRSFYGVKAVRFVMGENTTLKYGARLINSFLGDNSTISCCEVLNSLLFPFHEQHHNNSFLCAAQIEGQSNVASGATIGSNHNSRSADGELFAKRGFWPGLCVSLKHNSRFAAYTLITKGDFPNEIDNPFPFALVHHNVKEDRLEIMPAYWWLYNMYSLFRNQAKYKSRDQRKKNRLELESNFLSVDTVHEILQAIQLLNNMDSKDDLIDPAIYSLENSKRIPKLLKRQAGLKAYQEIVFFYCVDQWISTNLDSSLVEPNAAIWLNAGGILVTKESWERLKSKIIAGELNTWEDIHNYYHNIQNDFEKNKIGFIKQIGLHQQFVPNFDDPELNWNLVIDQYLSILDSIITGVKSSREKDYLNPFRKMIYQSEQEMNAVLGSFEKDQVIIDVGKMVSEKKRKAVEWLKNRYDGTGKPAEGR